MPHACESSLPSDALKVKPMIRLVIIAAMLASASGCTLVATTIASVGAGVGANHYIGSVNFKTFTEPVSTLKRATNAALRRMKIEQQAITEAPDAPESIRAKTAGRIVEIDFEVISPTVTRMRSVVRMEGSLLLDSATSQEIIVQTERVLVASPRTVQTVKRD